MKDWINKIIHSPGGFFQWEVDALPFENGLSREEGLASFVIRCLTNPNNAGSEAVIEEIIKDRYAGSPRPKFLTEVQNELIVVDCISEKIELFPSPHIETCVFTDQARFNAFVEDWKAGQEAMDREQKDDDLFYFGQDDWVYSLNVKYVEVNCAYKLDKISKRY